MCRTIDGLRQGRRLEEGIGLKVIFSLSFYMKSECSRDQEKR